MEKNRGKYISGTSVLLYQHPCWAADDKSHFSPGTRAEEQKGNAGRLDEELGTAAHWTQRLPSQTDQAHASFPDLGNSHLTATLVWALI